MSQNFDLCQCCGGELTYEEIRILGNTCIDCFREWVYLKRDEINETKGEIK